jgi:hypothetical protein
MRLRVSGITSCHSCRLHILTIRDAGARLNVFLAPAAKSPRGPFPGGPKASSSTASSKPAPPFPSKAALSNIPINVPLHFLGREGTLAEIEMALARCRLALWRGLRHFACLPEAASNPSTRTKHRNLAKRLARERAARIIAGAGQFPVRYQWPSAKTNFGRARKVNQTLVNDIPTASPQDRQAKQAVEILAQLLPASGCPERAVTTSIGQIEIFLKSAGGKAIFCTNSITQARQYLELSPGSSGDHTARATAVPDPI